MDTNVNRLLVLLGDLGTLDVEDELLAVAGDDLALHELELSTGNNNFVILTDRHGADLVLLLELLGERGAHELLASIGVGAEVGLAVLPPGGGDIRLCRHKPFIDQSTSQQIGKQHRRHFQASRVSENRVFEANENPRRNLTST